MNAYTLEQIIAELKILEEKMLREAEKRQLDFKNFHADQYCAAINLIHYLTVRNEDIRELQDSLHIWGLSSLASSESHIHSQLQSILQRLGHVYLPDAIEICTYDYNLHQMLQKSKKLFGEKNDPDTPYIMVTFDAAFADDYAQIKNLLMNGMNIARINCAHDEEATWSRMIKHVKRACRHTKLSCKIYMDLGGPKIRTKIIGKGSHKGEVKIKEGKLIWLAEESKGFDENDIVISPNEPGIIAMLKAGERVFIDDGVIKGVVESVKKNKAALRVVRISGDKKKIKSNKGINFPDSEISISPLTDFDRACLPFICQQADIVGYSFVRDSSDVQLLQDTLKEISQKPPKIIIKIETPEAVMNLPGLLLQGMRHEVFGVMIARGDLAVEIGFERMGEIQEEILWICESAHVPVIWATQVLETLNKTGLATRSEITDASYSGFAECVMINKGEHTVEVIETLKDI